MSDLFEEQDEETLQGLIDDPDWDCDQRWRAWCLLKQSKEAIARAEAAEARVQELEREREQILKPMTEMWARAEDAEQQLSWRPIAEYDAMEKKLDNYVFYDADPDISDPLSLTRFQHDTHFLQLPPVPGEG